MINIARQYAKLPPEKRSLFKQLLRTQGVDLSTLILPEERGDFRFPLSFAQQRMWFLYQLDPESPYYNIPSIYRLSGKLDLLKLEQCLSDIIARHESLRTIFGMQDGEPQQIILPEIPLPFQVIDLTGLAPDEREGEALRQAQAEALKPFNLSQGPLLRVVLWRLAEETHLAVITFHHIIADGWSMNVFINDLMTLYAMHLGLSASLPELDIQYVDYAAWQRRALQGDAAGQISPMEQQVNYWKTQLANCPPVLELPTDHPRPATQSFRGSYLPFEIPTALTEKVQSLARQEGVSLFMLLLAAFQTLLMRYSGQEDVCVGSPIANRGRVELEPLIGFFVNTLVLRSDLSGEGLTFRQLLARVKETCLGAYAHQDLPFEQIVEAVQPERNMSHNPLFQVMFVLQNAARGEQGLPGLTIRPVDAPMNTAKFDLTLTIAEQGTHLTGGFEYATDLFDAGTIERMIEHFQILLEGIAADADQAITRLPLLSAAERQQVLVTFNQTDLPIPEGQTVLDQIAEHVRRAPEAVALSYADQRLTYAELDARTNRLAHYLRGRGVDAESVVGLSMERSIELIVGLLGILKAGGAYLPMDPHYPADRLALMMEDSGVALVLTQAGLQSQLPESQAASICIDQDWQEIERCPETPTGNIIQPAQLAYMIYTSGSTGKPKGTLLHHRGLNNFVTGYTRAWGLDTHTSFLQFASISFDAAACEIFLTLCAGGRLILAPQETLLSAEELTRLINAQQINMVALPPAMLDLLDPDQLPGLETAASVADHCPPRVAKRWSSRKFLNGYGPTETTIGATQARIQVQPGETLESVTIGRPVANYHVYILDAQRNPQPVGIPGEIFIGGVSVARGYLNRPDLTAERFLPDPFSPESGARMYKTGDLARWLPNGDIDFLGRLDHQVKVRGFRIELGEIEAQLMQHPGIQQAAVNPVDDDHNGRSLAAYYAVTNTEQAPSNAEIISFLKARLPVHMVPAHFVRMEAIPLLPNGKINRKALPKPDGAPETVTAYRAPRTPVEQGLADIWQQALVINRAGLDDHFFELGGHSLRAAQLTARIRDVFQVEYPLRQVLDNPSLSEMALHIEGLIANRSGTPLPGIRPAERSGKLPLSFAQQRLWFLEQLDPGGSNYNIPLAVRLKGSLDIAAFQHSLDEMIVRHEALRTAFREENGIAYQAILPPYAMPLAIQDLSGLAEDQKEAEVRRLILADIHQPFSLTALPLMRTALLRLGQDEHVFVLVMHHIITDGWSMGVMARELISLYSAAVDPTQAVLPLADLPVQYADYAVWQRAWLQGEAAGEASPLKEQLDYWKQQLAGMPPQLELPTDRPRPEMQTSNGSNYAFGLSKEVSATLKALCQKEGVTLYMALMAAFQVLLYRYTGQEDFALGTPMANRSRAEIEPLIGFFVNTLVLRADVSDKPDFHTLLKRVRETCLGAYAHQDLPFEALVEALGTERSTARSPLFQVMFMLQNTPMPAQSFPGLTTEWLDLDPGTSTFDLTLALEETADGITGGFEYNTDLFDRETIARMAGHFRGLLEAALRDPAQPVTALPLLSEAERQQILVGFNQTARPDARLAFCVHQLVEQQAALRPDARAVFAPEDGTRLTYAQLNQRANQLARRLQAAGVERESLVTVCLERSADAIVTLLAILKAGGAYLPIDPVYPSERVQFMLADSGARVMVTHSRLNPPAAADNLQLICLDQEAETLAQLPDDNLNLPADTHQLAYVIYTSGSTGKPKGVMVEHHSLVNHNLAVSRLFELTPDDRMLQFASLSFDTSLEEIFPTLISGAELVIRPNSDLPTGSQLNQWAETWGLTILDLPTAYWHTWVGELSLGQPVTFAPSLRLVIVGGEKAHAEKLATWRQHVPERIRWFDGYGPTETAIIATAYYPPAQLPQGMLPIGKPLDNDRAYVLDAALQPVPIGVTGELLIAGEGVARGYLNRPELTAERFLVDPFMPEGRSKMYRSGDLARWLPDGTLEYRGRVDFQVKIRGFRVEPGEIETVLRLNPAVQQAVIVPRELDAVLQLVAYIVPGDPSNPPAVDTLRAFLKERLPDYMVPSAFVFLDHLPLTASNKIDRKALPEPRMQPAEASATFRGPRSAAEQALVEIWQKVLGRAQVGIDDNFFNLGGDSILSLQVVSRAAQAGLAVTPRLLFEHPTIAELAQLAPAAAPVPQAEQGPVSGAYPITPIQRWFFNLALPHPEHWNQSLLLSLPEMPDSSQLEQAVLGLINHHDALRSRYAQSDTGEWQAEITPPLLDLPSQPIHDLSMQPPEAQDAALSAACSRIQASFQLNQPPLIAYGLFWLGAQRGARLLLAAHHLVVDGVSWRIILEDLATALAQIQRGLPVNLPPKTASFRQWALELPEVAHSPDTLAELPIWLQDEEPAPLPVDRPVSGGSTGPARLQSFSLNAEDTQALLQKATPTLRATPEGLMLAALAWALRQWAGPQVYSIELEHHGRADTVALDVSRTVGWFTADFPLCLDLRQSAAPLDCLRSVKDRLNTIPRGGTGFGLLAAYHPEAAVRERLNRLAYPQITFNYLGQFGENAAAAGHSGALHMAAEARGDERSPLNPSSALLDINGGVFNGQLRLEFSYSPAVHDEKTIQTLVANFGAALHSYLHPEDGQTQAQVLTHTDFPLANLDQKKFKKVLEKLNQTRGKTTR